MVAPYCTRFPTRCLRLYTPGQIYVSNPYIGGSMGDGGGGARDAYSQSNFFQFHVVFGKNAAK